MSIDGAARTAEGSAREQPRQPISLRARMATQETGRLDVEVMDLSAHGCRLVASPALARGASLTITLPFLASIASTVCWSTADATGIRFDRPLHPTLVDMLVGIRRH